MKIQFLLRLGRRLMRLGSIHIVIVDDEDSYFTPQMISLANAAGYKKIKRLNKVTNEELTSWIKLPPDIIILDVKGIVDPFIAKDGIDVAARLSRETSAYIVITSAHQFHRARGRDRGG